jgi:small GTP-binding protein
MTAIIRDAAAKNELRAALVDVAALADAVGLASLAADLRGARIPKLDEERFHLVVLGEFNHGKSTFVNALLDAAVLPAGITPTTATINHLVFAEKPRARALLDDGRAVDVDPARVADWVTIEGKEVHDRGGESRYVEVGWPAEILRDRLTLVDTPGVNDLNEQRAEITYGYIPRADACLFLLDGSQVLKQSERTFLEQRILRRSRDKLVFVVGKCDLLSASERDEALAFCRTNLARIVDDPVVFAVSAKRWLAGDRGADTGMPALLDHLAAWLAADKGRVLLDNAVEDGQRAAAYLRSHLGIKRAALSLALDELEARIARVRRELEHRKATLRAIHETIRSESQAIRATMRLDVEEFARAFAEALPAEIERAPGADVKKFLASFLQDTFKSFAEAEGDKLAGLLEQLAEQVIQVTNENVAQTMQALARELGPQDTRVELEVDTLRYDVGVFALGALGTGIFLFVNSLVGGLLTLATPILAVVLRERAAEQVKAQAKEAAPEVVRKAGATVAERFGKVVDDFAAQLADFVNTAGEALHRGISEVLDRALAERRAQGADAQAQGREIGEQLERLSAIERRLGSLRDSLWASSTASPTGSAS